MRTSIFTSIVFLFLLSLTAQADSLTVADIWSEYKFFPNRVEGFRSTKDGEHFTRFALIDGEKSIVKYSFQNRETAGEVLMHGKDLIFENEKRKADDYSFNANEDKLLIQTNFEKKYRRSYTAEFIVFDINTKKSEPLDPERSPQTLAKFSPNGKYISYIFENNIYVKNIETKEVVAVTTDGKTNHIINGTTDWVYEEEFAFTEAYEWSPDGSHIAYLRFDESHVKEFTMTYHYDLYPDLYTYKYPKAGEENSKVSLYIYHLEDASFTNVQLGEHEYIPRIKWSPLENKLIALTLNRHQNHLKYHWISASNTKGDAELIYEETDDAYVEIDDNLMFMPDGESFIRTSEKDGYNHIYQVFLNGKVKQITKGNWDVVSFKGIHEKKKRIYYTSSESSPMNRNLYSIDFKGNKKELLSLREGTNEPIFSTKLNYYVNEWSNANTPPISTLHLANGEVLDTLEANEILQLFTKKYDFQKKEFITIPGAEMELNAWMIKPPLFDSTKQYPVYFNIYCGPGSNLVTNSFGSANFAYHQLLAQQGYIVISVDTRGTMNRGAAFKKSTYLQLGKLETEDLIEVAKNVRQWSFVNPERIGIMGWSYGGYMTSLAMTKGADIFKMGIAVAPVTNWRFYDNIYTERFMRTPQENAKGYDENSPINHVKKLKGKYFIIHGDGDDNVHVQNTLEMVKALVRENKQFELFIYPNKNHGIYGGNTRNHLFEMILNYTIKNL